MGQERTLQPSRRISLLSRSLGGLQGPDGKRLDQLVYPPLPSRQTRHRHLNPDKYRTIFARDQKVPVVDVVEIEGSHVAALGVVLVVEHGISAFRQPAADADPIHKRDIAAFLLQGLVLPCSE